MKKHDVKNSDEGTKYDDDAKNNHKDINDLGNVNNAEVEMRKNKSQETRGPKKRKQVDLTVNEALVLQQVFEDGEEDVDDIVDQIGMPKRITMNILSDLKSKGLLTVIQRAYGKILVSVTSQGKKLVHTMWPEAVLVY